MKKFLYISSIFVILILLSFLSPLIFSCIVYPISMLKEYHSGHEFIVVFASITIYSILLIYLIIHFSFPYNYKDKYLRCLFIISYIILILDIILNFIFMDFSGDNFITYIFLLPTFIFMTIMLIIKFIIPRFKLNSNDRI